MANRENAVNALERAWNYIDVQRRTYQSVFKNNSFQTFDDVLSGIKTAIALLKAQEARVMTLDEVRNWVNSDRVTREPVVIEIHGGVCAWIIDDEVRELSGEADLSSDLYGKTWRCWTSRPTREQMEAVKWE